MQHIQKGCSGGPGRMLRLGLVPLAGRRRDAAERGCSAPGMAVLRGLQRVAVQGCVWPPAPHHAGTSQKAAAGSAAGSSNPRPLLRVV